MLVFDHVAKSYPGPERRVEVLRDLSFTLDAGDLAIVQGPSGCGKSTLLFTAGAMLPPDRGRVQFGGNGVYGLPRYRRNRLRASSVGFIFQRFHLMPYLTVEENLLWPLRWCADSEQARRRLPELCRRLGLRHRLAHRPAQLSAGEQQRVAVVRALLGEKKLICADEPTGNLDEENADLVIGVLQEEAARGCMVLLVTHQHELAGLGNIHLAMGSDGRVVRTDRNHSQTGERGHDGSERVHGQ